MDCTNQLNSFCRGCYTGQVHWHSRLPQHSSDPAGGLHECGARPTCLPSMSPAYSCRHVLTTPHRHTLPHRPTAAHTLSPPSTQSRGCTPEKPSATCTHKPTIQSTPSQFPIRLSWQRGGAREAWVHPMTPPNLSLGGKAAHMLMCACHPHAPPASVVGLHHHLPPHVSLVSWTARITVSNPQQ